MCSFCSIATQSSPYGQDPVWPRPCMAKTPYGQDPVWYSEPPAACFCAACFCAPCPSAQLPWCQVQSHSEQSQHGAQAVADRLVARRMMRCIAAAGLCRHVGGAALPHDTYPLPPAIPLPFPHAVPVFPVRAAGHPSTPASGVASPIVHGAPALPSVPTAPIGAQALEASRQAAEAFTHSREQAAPAAASSEGGTGEHTLDRELGGARGVPGPLLGGARGVPGPLLPDVEVLEPSTPPPAQGSAPQGEPQYRSLLRLAVLCTESPEV